MKQFFIDYLMEIILIPSLTVLLTILRKQFKQAYEYIFKRFIRSRWTPKRLTNRERIVMERGIVATTEEVREILKASHIITFIVEKNGTNTLKQVLDVRAKGKDRMKGIEGIATADFSDFLEDLEKEGWLSVVNTENSKKYRNFCDCMYHTGVKSFDALHIPNRYNFAFFLIVHATNRFTDSENSKYVQNMLSSLIDSIITIYVKK